jgi:RNA polymerase sigma-70 factor (ECF subfamily)
LSHEDKLLAERIVRGDEEAFRLFFDRYYSRIYRFCSRRLEAASAEDAAQKVMIQAVRKMGTYRGEAALLTWMTQIARNAITAEYRADARHSHLVAVEDSESIRAEVETVTMDPLLNPETRAEQEQRQHLVQLILDHLPGRYGDLLEWKYIEGLSVEEIAERLGVTGISAQSMLARARRAFRTQYESLAAEVQDIIGADSLGETDNG